MKRLLLLLFFQFNFRVLDDLRYYHTTKETSDNIPFNTFYFYKAVLHENVYSFQAKNYRLGQFYWKCIFKRSFRNLKVLNLALSCTDCILQLIPEYCPQLEYLNATCKYERIMDFSSQADFVGNARVFSLSVTDKGLGFLCTCRKLKTLTINEPRSQGRGINNSISYTGLQRLLREVHTLEDITYSDLGTVLSHDMADIESLNLRIIRHFNGTVSSLREIFRLCKRLNELYLVFFNPEPQPELVDLITTSGVMLRCLETQNLTLGRGFDNFFDRLGPSLMYLSLTNTAESLTFSNLVTIGRCCPQLRYFGCVRLVNSNESILRPRDLNQFSLLQSLYLSGHDMNIANVLIFCTENATNLENFKLSDRSLKINADRMFGEWVTTANLRHIEVSSGMEFSRAAIIDIMQRFNQMRYLNVYCPDNIEDLKQDIRNCNYEFTFINKSDRNTFL